MGNLEHAQELNEEGSQSAGYNCLLWSWAISQQQATCMNTTEWLQEAVTRVQKTNQSAIFTSRSTLSSNEHSLLSLRAFSAEHFEKQVSLLM